MTSLKEINVFTIGDSNKARTWSNVPYLLTITLEKKGYKVNRLNIVQNKYLQAIYHRLVFLPLVSLGLIKKDSIFHYKDSKLNYILTFFKIKRMNKRHPGADINIFTNFSFNNKFSSKPNVLFHDWDVDIAIKDKLQREPYSYEKNVLARQRIIIENADMIISMFSNAAERMRNSYKNPNIFYLNQNVINNLYEEELDKNYILNIKRNSYNLLFIGTDKYIDGAKLLVEAFSNLRSEYPSLILHLIGIKISDFAVPPPAGVVCHGYLDKSVKRERDLYYELIINSKIFINPTPVWGGYSSTIEAMFFYNPIIVAPYDEFIKDFGNDISFGKLCNEFSKDHLIGCIRYIMDNDNYQDICENAHNTVKDYTWDIYTDKLLSQINNHIKL